MKRRLFNLAAAISLVLCVSTAALWVRSYGAPEEFVWHGHDGDVGFFATQQGTALFAANRGPREVWPAEWYGLRHTRDPRAFPVVAALSRMHSLSIDRGDEYVMWSRGGFGWYYYQPRSRGYSLRRAIVPFWALTLATAMLPIGWVAHRLHARRSARLGLCTCGYDLCESPDRCPECGTANPAHTSAA
jgi:hypothetical protein